MSSRVSLLWIMLCVLLMGCSPPVSKSELKTPSGEVQLSPTPTSLSVPLESKTLSGEAQASGIKDNLGQTLPISAKAIIAGEAIALEVARTPEQQAMGLMYRTSLADDRGMLFEFGTPRPIGFWMKNTLIPLDMIFMRDGVVKFIAANVPPCTTSICPTYGPDTPTDRVIELRGGRAAELGLKVGDRVTIEQLDTNTDTPTRPAL
ncbi:MULTISPECIES: DUF192 domain-containing protein [Cyanophyceae]|uniref:DUF192 domain-containing protein n=1 Tax=Cyanophyceae TaxID=3028117 RepID=UPI0028C473FF|nr:DUF192 domain-containing protein [Trichocoleus sp. FACHB-69]